MSSKKTLILAIYPREPGGEWRATKQLLAQYKKLFSQSRVKEIEVKKFKQFMKPGLRFQLFRNKTENALTVWNELSLQLQIKVGIVFSPSLFYLFITCLHPKTRKARKYFYFNARRFNSPWEEAKIVNKSLPIRLYVFFYYLFISLYEAVVLKKIEKTICPSKYSKGNVLKHYSFIKPSKIVIIESGIDKKIFHPTKRKKNLEKPRMLYSGRLAREKGILNLLKTAGNLLELNFVIAYPETPDRMFEQIIERKTSRLKNVKLVKNQRPNQLAKLYQQSTLTLLPAFGEHEQLPLVFLESIACGTPVLSTDVGELGTLQKKIGKSLLLKNASSKELTNKIIWFMKLAEEQRKQLRRNCLILSKQFSWEEAAKKLHNTFHSSLYNLQ